MVWPFKSKQVEQIAVKNAEDVRAAISGAESKASEAVKDEAKLEEAYKQYTLALNQLLQYGEQTRKVALSLKGELAGLDGAVKNIENTMTDTRNATRLTRFYKAKALCEIRDTGIRSVAGEVDPIRKTVELILGRSLGPKLDLNVINKTIAGKTISLVPGLIRSLFMTIHK